MRLFFLEKIAPPTTVSLNFSSVGCCGRIISICEFFHRFTKLHFKNNFVLKKSWKQFVANNFVKKKNAHGWIRTRAMQNTNCATYALRHRVTARSHIYVLICAFCCLILNLNMNTNTHKTLANAYNSNEWMKCMSCWYKNCHNENEMKQYCIVVQFVFHVNECFTIFYSTNTA